WQPLPAFLSSRKRHPSPVLPAAPSSSQASSCCQSDFYARDDGRLFMPTCWNSVSIPCKLSVYGEKTIRIWRTFMSEAYAYPLSRFEPAIVPDLNDKSARQQLSKSALKAFYKLADAWQLRDEDACTLLGGLSSSAFYEWKKKPDRLLEVDRITRISYLLGIY